MYNRDTLKPSMNGLNDLCCQYFQNFTEYYVRVSNHASGHISKFEAFDGNSATALTFRRICGEDLEVN